ncbi:MAG TPA: hypothetical protein VFH46_19410 [Pyrinomonadaceae bacterium]|nr:hypothetical protein [Pyrinomonadaceae bacterium]
MVNHKSASSYVLCIDDGGYRVSLEVRKVYVTLPDERAAEDQFIRVIDETGEDYLYPAKLFVPIEIPPQATTVLFNDVTKFPD